MKVSFPLAVSVGTRLPAMSCGLVTVVFAAYMWVYAQATGRQASEQVFARIGARDRSIAATVALFGEAPTTVSMRHTLFTLRKQHAGFRADEGFDAGVTGPGYTAFPEYFGSFSGVVAAQLA